jgi:hypothetical protein
MISFGKLIFLVALIVGVWYAFKYVARVRANFAASERPRPMPRPAEARKRGSFERHFRRAKELIACPKCGAYVSDVKAHHCQEGA